MSNGGNKPRIVITGGGPAGSSLAIRLAETGFDVTLVERERFPRHKLCGEFISPECLRHFERLGVREEMLSRGGARISKTVFHAPSGRSVEVPSSWFGASGAALSLSRAEMDHRLLERAKKIGVSVIEGAGVNGVSFDGSRVAGLTVRRENGSVENFAGEIFIDATGRARVLARMIEKRKHSARKPAGKSGLVGFKAHLRNANVDTGCCDIYSFPGGYGGLSPIEDGFVNHCFLVRSEVVRKMKGDADTIVENSVYRNQRARTILHGSDRVGDWLAVSVDGFGIRDLNPAANVFAAGDSAAFIDPFTGSGMLMALESSEMLAGLIGERSADLSRLSARYQRAFRSQFRTRLRVCSILRRAAFTPSVARAVISVLGASNSARRILTRWTRSNTRLMDG